MMNKADRAYELLRVRIADGTYVPGQRLVVDQLSRESGISTIPWREAVRRLEAEGWIEVIPHSGARVKGFEDGAWVKTVRLVARLEGLATGVSAASLTQEDLARAREVDRQMGEALAAFDPHRFGELSTEFHSIVCLRTGDPRLEDLLRAEWTRLDVVRRATFWHAPGRAADSLAEHEALLDLIEARASSDEIERAARQHKMNTVDAAVDYEAGQVAAGRSRLSPRL